MTADPDNPILATYGENALKSRLRAHPDVAARHHADLCEPGIVRADTITGMN